MNIVKTIGCIAVIYGAVKIGGYTYRTYEKWSDKGFGPFAEHVVNETGRKIENVGEYLQNVKIDRQKEKQPSSLEKTIEKNKK